MSTVIKDGTGASFNTKVDSNNRLQALSIDVPLVAQKAIDGDTYVITTAFLPVTTTEGLVQWFTNNETDKILVIETVQIFFNGGDTNHNRMVKWRSYPLTTEPTTNTVTSPFANFNSTSAKTFNGIHKYWDGVGTGMTGHVLGPQTSAILIGQSGAIFAARGVQLIGPGLSIGATMEAEETGVASIFVVAYLIPITGENF